MYWTKSTLTRCAGYVDSFLLGLGLLSLLDDDFVSFVSDFDSDFPSPELAGLSASARFLYESLR